MVTFFAKHSLDDSISLKGNKFDLGWGSAPDPAGGDYSAPADPLAAFKVPYF